MSHIAAVNSVCEQMDKSSIQCTHWNQSRHPVRQNKPTDFIESVSFSSAVVQEVHKQQNQAEYPRYVAQRAKEQDHDNSANRGRLDYSLGFSVRGSGGVRGLSDARQPIVQPHRVAEQPHGREEQGARLYDGTCEEGLPILL